MAQAGAAIGENGGFGDALRTARAAEAAHFEAVHALSDAKSLRLQILKDELAVIVAASPEAGWAFELALAPGDPPRLWIDLITSVVMEPDPKTYRLVQHGQSGRDTLFETADRAEMVQQVKLTMAHAIIANRRQGAASGLEQGNGRRYSAASLALAGLGGFSLGALALLGAAIYLEILSF